MNFYYVRGQIFNNDLPRWNGKGKAIHYCKSNGIDESEIYELSNNSELVYLKELLEREDVSEIETHKTIFAMLQFTNANGDLIPQMDIQCSFKYKENGYYQFVAVIDSVYELTKLFILQKIIVDYFSKDYGGYLKVLYLDDEGLWKEWKLQDVAPFVKEKKEQHKRLLAQKREIRERQKYDRLLKLRSEGKITERQSQELYRLEKVFGG